MSTTISRLYNWVTDKANSVKITASRQDGELDQIIVALNRKVLCSGSAPSSPIAGQTWVDTTNKFLKHYRNNEWVIMGAVHVSTTGNVMATPQEGDLWYDTTLDTLKTYNGAAWVTLNNTPPINYRSQLYVMQASTTTMTVSPGIVEVNGAAVQKTANVTLTITTAGNWAGGSSQQAVSTVAYVVIDASGNIKMTTTAPTHADYALAVSAANNTKRYATISGTVYRYLGWFYMNATGSGELDAFGVSNIADGNVQNVVELQTGAVATGTTVIPVDDSIPQNTEGDQIMSQVFRPTNVNNKLRITVIAHVSGSTANIPNAVALFQDATAGALAAMADKTSDSQVTHNAVTVVHHMKAATIALTTFKVRAGVGTGGGTLTFNGIAGGRLLGGVITSSIRIEEIESQLT